MSNKQIDTNTEISQFWWNDVL